MAKCEIEISVVSGRDSCQQKPCSAVVPGPTRKERGSSDKATQTNDNFGMKTKTGQSQDLPPKHESRQNRQRGSSSVLQSLEERWSYVIISCSFMVTVLTLGFKTSLGVFYTEWEYYFDVTKTQVSWVTSLSPVVIGITSKYIFVNKQRWIRSFK